MSEQELSAWLIQQAPRYGMAPQQLADVLVKNGGVNMAVADIRRAKALEVVLKSVQVVDTKGVVVEVNSSPGLEGIEKATSADVAKLMIMFLEKNAKPGRTRTKGKG